MSLHHSLSLRMSVNTLYGGLTEIGAASNNSHIADLTQMYVVFLVSTRNSFPSSFLVYFHLICISLLASLVKYIIADDRDSWHSQLNAVATRAQRSYLWLSLKKKKGDFQGNQPSFAKLYSHATMTAGDPLTKARDSSRKMDRPVTHLCISASPPHTFPLGSAKQTKLTHGMVFPKRCKVT